MWKTRFGDPLERPEGRIREALKRATEQIRFGLEDLKPPVRSWTEARELLRERILGALVSPMRAQEREAFGRWVQADPIASGALLDQLGRLLVTPASDRAEPRRQLELRLFAIVAGRGPAGQREVGVQPNAEAGAGEIAPGAPPGESERAA